MMKELIKKRDEAKAAQEAAQKQIVDLTAKHDGLQENLPKLKRAVDQAENFKKEALSSYVLNKISVEELSQRRDAFENAKSSEAEANELIEAIHLAKRKIEKDLPNLDNQHLAAERELWNYIYNDIKEDIKRVLGDKLARAYSARLKTGFASYDFLVQDLFGGMPSHELVQQIQANLTIEYLGLGEGIE